MAEGRPPTLAARHLAELVEELGGLCAGCTVREVESLPPRDLLLVLEPRVADGSGDEPPHDRRIRRLRLSADPAHARAHLQLGRVRLHRGPHAPFFRLVQEALEGAVLERLEALPGERILRLEFARAGERRALLLEAIGRHANLLLCDAEGRLEGILVEPRADSPAAARLRPGVPWAPPSGGSPPAVPPLAEAFEAPPPPHPGQEDLVRLAPLSWRVEAALGLPAERTLAEELRGDLKRRIRRRLKGARSRRAGLEARELEIARAERLQHDAELLLAQHPTAGRGRTTLDVVDYFAPDAPTRTLALDPKRSARENADQLFARAKKLRRASERLPAELSQARDQEAALEELLRLAEDPERDPFELEERAIAAGTIATRPAPPSPHKKAKAPPPRLPYHVFRGQKGGEIRVGRSARDNDELTFRASRGSDLWLHTSDSPGSHVVLRVEKGAEPDPEEVLDAAHLAVHFSPLSGARRADVHVARCKEVKKPRRAPAGLVTLAGGRTLHVRVEEGRLRRLLASAGPGAPPPPR